MWKISEGYVNKWRRLNKHVNYTDESCEYSRRAPVSAESDTKRDSTHGSWLMITDQISWNLLFLLSAPLSSIKLWNHHLADCSPLCSASCFPPVDLVMVWHGSCRSGSQWPAVVFFSSAGWGLAEPLEQNFKGLNKNRWVFIWDGVVWEMQNCAQFYSIHLI